MTAPHANVYVDDEGNHPRSDAHIFVTFNYSVSGVAYHSSAASYFFTPAMLAIAPGDELDAWRARTSARAAVRRTSIPSRLATSSTLSC